MLPPATADGPGLIDASIGVLARDGRRPRETTAYPHRDKLANMRPR
jgi:hypothetical protein